MEIKTKFNVGDKVILKHRKYEPPYQLPQIFIVSSIGTHTSSASDEEDNFLLTGSKIAYELFPVSFGADPIRADENDLMLATKENVEKELDYAVAKIKEELLNKCIKE